MERESLKIFPKTLKTKLKFLQPIVVQRLDFKNLLIPTKLILKILRVSSKRQNLERKRILIKISLKIWKLSSYHPQLLLQLQLKLLLKFLLPQLQLMPLIKFLLLQLQLLLLKFQLKKLLQSLYLNRKFPVIKSWNTVAQFLGAICDSVILPS